MRSTPQLVLHTPWSVYLMKKATQYCCILPVPSYSLKKSPSFLQSLSSLVQHHHFVVAPSVTFWIMSSLVPLFPSVTPSGLHCTFFLPSATPSGYQVKAESQSLLSLIPSAHVSCSLSFNQSSIHAIRRLRSEPTTHGNGC